MLVHHVTVVISNKSVLPSPNNVNAPEVKIDEELALKWLKDGAKQLIQFNIFIKERGILKNLMTKNNFNLIYIVYISRVPQRCSFCEKYQNIVEQK